MTKDWKPTKEDIEWTKIVLNALKVGGVWGTSYGVYSRSKENEMRLDRVLWDAQERGFPVEENLRKTAIAIKKCGYVYTEADGARERRDE